MEKNSEVFTELKSISKELEMLEQYVKTTFDTLENNFNSFIRHIDVLSELIDFQRSVISFKESDKMILTLFDFLYRNLKYDHGFIVFKLRDNDPEYTVITNRSDQLEVYKKFIDSPDVEILSSLIKDRDMAYLISDVQQFYRDKIHWDILQAKSIILFPIKVRGKSFGIGFLIRQEEPFELNQLSFVNLNVGVIALLVYQHYYFSSLKSQFIPRSFRTGFKKALEEAEEGQVQYFRSPMEEDGGTKHILEYYISRIELQDRFNLLLIFAIDITQVYYKELYLRQSEMLDELDQFSRTLVGEFNNLLTIIVPNISLLRTSLRAEHPYQIQLASMEKAAQRSSNLIRKFLNYDLEDFEIPEQGSLNKMVKAYTMLLKNEKPPEVAIKTQLDSGLKAITYYPLRLRQLLKILIDNSLAALKDRESPEIQFITTYVNHRKSGILRGKKFYLPAGEYAELCIRDNGSGISEQSLPQVFKPFYSTKIKNEGVGLGLFIAYNIVKDMKGEIFIDSKIGEYTAVYVYLPIRQKKPVETPVVETEKKTRASKKTQPTILVVDDEYNIRSMMKEIMEMYGFKVYTAGNGRDGVDVYLRRKDEIDLVILDMVMPVMDGRAAFIEIKKINPKQKIFIISGYSQREDLDEILREGADGFMRKPFQVHNDH
ncbi:hypothetical protein B1H10_07080 [candidate division KSB1 bacterium 4484_188]|nr:MAG: hypothetical protein B1H10_07080 [candidate division KSB1 bacterium 4484_188]